MTLRTRLPSSNAWVPGALDGSKVKARVGGSLCPVLCVRAGRQTITVAEVSAPISPSEIDPALDLPPPLFHHTAFEDCTAFEDFRSHFGWLL